MLLEVLVYGVCGVLAAIIALLSYRYNVDQIYCNFIERSLCTALSRAPQDNVSYLSFSAGLAHAIHVISS
jgi:hypothetical protein